VGQRSEHAIFHMPEKKVKKFSAISGLQCYLEYIDPVAPIDVYTYKYCGSRHSISFNKQSSLPKRVKDAKDQIQWEEGLYRRVATQDNQYK
jgi:hypothetical protein